MDENSLSYKIIGIALKVHTELGPGLLESVYEAAMAYELQNEGYVVQSQLGLPARYKSIQLNIGFRIDILVNDLVVIEIKSVEALADVHKKQLLTHLKLSGKKLGLLINFNASSLKSSIIRIVNNL